MDSAEDFQELTVTWSGGDRGREARVEGDFPLHAAVASLGATRHGFNRPHACMHEASVCVCVCACVPGSAVRSIVCLASGVAEDDPPVEPGPDRVVLRQLDKQTLVFGSV